MSSNGHGYKKIDTATNRINIFCIKFRITTRVFYINLFLDQIDICDSRHRISPWKKLDRPYIKGDSKTRNETEKKIINKLKKNETICFINKGNNKIAELRTILQRESQNS